MSSLVSVLRGLVLLGLLASCASQPVATTRPSPAPASSAPASSAPVGSTPASSVPASSVSTTDGAGPSTPAVPSLTTRPLVPPVAGQQLTLTGTIEEGVEHGCLLLTDTATGRRYNLTGGNPAIIKVGVKVKVVGVIRKDLMSYCQQGAIFQVLTGTAG